MRILNTTKDRLVIQHSHPVIMTLCAAALLIGAWMVWRVAAGQGGDPLRAAIALVLPLSALVWLLPVTTLTLDKPSGTLTLTRKRPLGKSSHHSYHLSDLASVGMRRIRGNCSHGWQVFLQIDDQLVPLTEGQTNLTNCSGFETIIEGLQTFAEIGDLPEVNWQPVAALRTA